MRNVIYTLLVLSLASAAQAATPSSPSSPIPASGSGPSKRVFGVTIANGKLISTLDGSAVQLRGANYSSMETLADDSTDSVMPTNLSSKASAEIIQRYSNANLGKYPWWNTAKAWKMNAFRIPLNEASWLRDYTGVEIHGDSTSLRQPDVSGNLRAAVKQMVSDLIAAGFYVILDLHWTAPGHYLGNSQDQLPDTDHSIPFWTSVAQTFGNNPAVIFDLFNEPYPGGSNEAEAFRNLLNGSPQSEISCDSGRKHIPYSWNSAGMQTLVNTVRATGAINVLLAAGAGGAEDLSGFTIAGGGYFPKDPLHNTAASWHAYGVNSPDYTMRNATFSGTINPTTVANTLLAEGIPIVIGEVGDASANGTASAPVIKHMTSWADQHGAGVIAWSWNVWNDSEGHPGKRNALIKNAAGEPTDGEGVAFKDWLSRH